MSQVCPSSSHQLVAAAMAFRRARRKFPKNYGLCSNPEETNKLDKTESVSGTENQSEQENLSASSKKPSSNSKPGRVERKNLWNDECGENASIKENLVEKPIVCSCCRKRNEQCSAGDTLDVVPSKEYNGATKKIEFSKLDKNESPDSKTMTKGFPVQLRNSSCGRISFSNARRLSPKETSGKLDSVNLLYDRDQAETDNVKSSGSPEKRNCDVEERDFNCGRRGWTKSNQRNSRCVFPSKKNNTLSPNVSRPCDCNCVKRSTVDLLRGPRECCRHRCCQSHDHSHRCCGHEHNNNCSSKEKRLASDTCLCPSNVKDHKSCCYKCHSRYESTCDHDYCSRDAEKISTVQEQNDEEVDDAVGTIYHKDSLCILVEKYKANKKCKHKKQPGEIEASEERFKEECGRSFTSEISCPTDDMASTNQGEIDVCRFRDNRPSIGKQCRHGCGQILREEDSNQLKNLKACLIKTGTCCSAKGTPWRRTF